jgi:hypothetical protein
MPKPIEGYTSPERRERFFLKSPMISNEWTEVTREKWIQAERASGFRPKMSSDDPRYMDTMATGGFSSSAGLSGCYTMDGSVPTW